MPGLGWVDAEVVRFRVDVNDKRHKVPHMGWERVTMCRRHTLFADLERPRFYFVHSYYMRCNRPENVLAAAHYQYEFCAAVGENSILGTQFHPEKSH